jgi:hypothetical protein
VFSLWMRPCSASPSFPLDKRKENNSRKSLQSLPMRVLLICRLISRVIIYSPSGPIESHMRLSWRSMIRTDTLSSDC